MRLYTLFSPDEELEEAKKIVPESTWYRLVVEEF